ncbi:hypothetical protein EFP18_23360 [Burkholderia glumae]|uniref:hypothetical protein n=1 Tax=Burkholderia glumae TaxID=337 RepID=UPI0021645BBA|nr:hypothetical protein [Burkholderia glumae]UVS87023.1 hypothetical protein EFP18_23360 [Burkholderia glumae]
MSENNTTAPALTDEQRAAINMAISVLTPLAMDEYGDALRALLTSPRAAVPADRRKDFETAMAAIPVEDGNATSFIRNGDDSYVQRHVESAWLGFSLACQMLDAAPAAPVAPVAPVAEPTFTDAGRAAIAWVLWHHQGASSFVGQPIRYALGMGQYEELSDAQIAEAKAIARLCKFPGKQHSTSQAVAAPVAEYDGNHVQNHCTECNEHEAECSCAQAVAADGAEQDELQGIVEACEELGCPDGMTPRQFISDIWSLLIAWYQASSEGKIAVSDPAYHLVTATAALMGDERAAVSPAPVAADGAATKDDVDALTFALGASVMIEGGEKYREALKRMLDRERAAVSPAPVAADGAAMGKPSEIERVIEERNDAWAATEAFETDLAEILGTEPGSGARDRIYEAIVSLKRAAVSPATADTPLNGIAATMFHGEGAIARCSYCGRYSLDRKTLGDRPPKCECGEKHGWSGSFEKPGPDAKWSGAAPSGMPATADERAPQVKFSQFLTDVITAAGLLQHGRTDKKLAARIGEMAFSMLGSSPSQAVAPAEPTDYAAIEREHFGDPDKRTGIYAPATADERAALTFDEWRSTYADAMSASDAALAWSAARASQAAAPADAREPHADDVAVDEFAIEMKAKMAAARTKGRSGWETCAPADLSRMLREHVEKGDPRDVANFCMMLHHHGAPIGGAADAGEAVAIGFRTRIPGFDWVPWLTDNQETIRKAIADALAIGSEASKLYSGPVQGAQGGKGGEA